MRTSLPAWVVPLGLFALLSLEACNLFQSKTENIDSCHNRCPAEATCVMTDNGAPTCQCPLGKVIAVDWGACLDDPCLDNNGGCDMAATCDGSSGLAVCSCKSGYTGDGRACTDKNECLPGPHGEPPVAHCDPNATCTNTPGSFLCACNLGFATDPASNPSDPNSVVCDDLNECAGGLLDQMDGGFVTVDGGLATADGGILPLDDAGQPPALKSPCDPNAVCSNTVGSFKCTCNSGYGGDGVQCQDVDECAMHIDNCDSIHGGCTNTIGSFTCSCINGFTLNADGHTCDDVDECAPGPNGEPSIANCTAGQVCTNTIGSFSCTCPTGYAQQPNGYCKDIDECAAGTAKCATGAVGTMGAICHNTPGSYTCVCPAGFAGDGIPVALGGTACTDIDECATHTAQCDTNAACKNTVGSYTCTCNAGWAGNGRQCTDINECTNHTDNCTATEQCVNLPGSFRCDCQSGYTLVSASGVQDCVDINECSQTPAVCDPNATCTNTPGSYGCQCKSGYVLDADGHTCDDVNECAMNNGGCDKNATCTNTPGSFTCACNNGYSGNGTSCVPNNPCTNGSAMCDSNALCQITGPGTYACQCKTGYQGAGTPGTCTDINECQLTPSVCDPHATCANSIGSYSCTCNSGWSGNGTSCVDMNECGDGTAVCDPNATCTNGTGTYTCACKTGYQGDGKTCTPILPCNNGTAVCDPHATCSNTTPGNYACTCNMGYIGDGKTCQLKTPCNDGTATCDLMAGATCTNLSNGSFQCGCPSGFTGNGMLASAGGTSCTDINECTQTPSVCDTHAACTNTPGSYTCACNTGWQGSGAPGTCQDTNECGDGTAQCDTNATCTNGVGTYTCACKPGFTGSGAAGTCQNLNECTLALQSGVCTGSTCKQGTYTWTACDANATCADTSGSYTCTCKTGYRGNGFTCTPINPCQDGTVTCSDPNASCVYLSPGQATCQCKSGYTGNGQTCVDINECQQATQPNTCVGSNCSISTGGSTYSWTNCDANATCTNTAGSYTCACNTNYVGTGYTCNGENRCTDGTNMCSSNASCMYTGPGTYSCTCNMNYTGDGYNCTAVNHCADNTAQCDPSTTTCVFNSSVSSGYTCQCLNGYQPGTSNLACVDVNECTSGTCSSGTCKLGSYSWQSCDPIATCTNTTGSYSCACPSGVPGNGYSCQCTNVGTLSCTAGTNSTGAGSATAQVNLTTATNYRFAWPAVGDAALVATISSFTTFPFAGDLHLLKKGGVDITLGTNVELNSVEVNLKGSKPSVVWMQNVSTSGVGVAYFADLSLATPTPVALNSSSLGIQHAGAGNQLLLLGNAPSGGGVGSLFWSNGATVSAVIGTAQATRSISALYNAAQTVAVVAVNQTTTSLPSGSFRGDLYAVDLTTGNVTKIATSMLVAVNNEPSYAVSANGSTVAYIDEFGGVYAGPINGSTVYNLDYYDVVSPPALSADGTLVAYTMNAKAWVTNVNASPNYLPVGNFTGKIAAPPVFAPDNKSILYFSNITLHGGLIGDGYIAPYPPAATPAPFAVGTKIAIESPSQNLFYTPIETTSCGNDYLLNANLVDQTLTTADWNGVGQATWVNTTSCSAGTPLKTTTLQTKSGTNTVPIKVVTNDMLLLKGGATAAFTGDLSYSSISTGDLFVIGIPNLGAGPFTKVASGVAVGTLRASPYASRAAFMQNTTTSPAIDSGQTSLGTFSTVDAAGTVTTLAQGALNWVSSTTGVAGTPLTGDGRAIVILPTGSGTLGAGVWLVPVP